jgi:hypothetical protein
MKSTLTLILLSILITGCSRSDAKIHRQIIGSWNGGSMTFEADGSFRAQFPTPAEWTQEQDGTWDVKDGYLIMTVTNSRARNEPVILPVGHVSRCKVTFSDAHTFIYKSPDGRESFSQNR